MKRKYRLSSFGKIDDTKNISTEFFVIKINTKKNQFPKFAFIVSKKIDNRATVRNKSRRILQSSVQEIIDQIIPYTYLLIAKKSIEGKQKEISRSMKEIFTKEKLLINK